MTHLSEQIGELRAMILDRDKTIQGIELKAIKAADLVESVQPDKLMTSIQKEDAKFEALKANLEGNEAIMNQVMSELKEMRKKVDFIRGVDEIIKLSEQVKEDLIEIKKVEASVRVESEKTSAMYTEIRKKYKDIDTVSSSLQEVKVGTDQHGKDIDIIKTKITELATRDDLDKLVQKVQRYIDTLKELNKSSTLTKDLSRLKMLLEEMK
jgi:septal ring factor EnvC (AmiA/AmiB activator)